MTASLHVRVLLAASVVLAAFLGLTGWVLDEAFRSSAETALQERLRGHLYTLLAGAELDARGELRGPDQLAEPRFNRPASGLYAEIMRPGRRPHWRSPSSLGDPVRAALRPATGESLFETVESVEGTPLYVLSFGVLWEEDLKKPRRYVFRVAETLDGFHGQVGQFRRSLWGWLGGAAALLLAVQGLILRWGLKPLRRAAHDLAAIESGRASRLTGVYPAELKGLTDNLNALLQSAEALLGRYRDTLGNLAHSLKTPLAVLQNVLDKPGFDEARKSQAVQQVQRMNGIVSYQLQRAATSGRTHLAGPVAVRDKARQIRASLAKVYAAKPVDCQLRIDSGAVFRGDEGDLLEILGNLMDNAYKWCRGRVLVSVPASGSGSQARDPLELWVEDDGPGIGQDSAARVLQRGERSHGEFPGHGLGLAIVESIAGAYGGTVVIESSELGGARVIVRL